MFHYNNGNGNWFFFSQEWILNTTINERFRAFYLGFHSVCASNALIMLRPEEVEQVGINNFTLKATFSQSQLPIETAPVIIFHNNCTG